MDDRNPHHKQLTEKYPHTLGHARLSFGSGWTNLVDNLTSDLKAIEEKVQACIVKEKFGGLRYQLGPPIMGAQDVNWHQPRHGDKLRERIHKAEKRSLEICERCGSEDNVTTTSTEFWIKTHCDACRVQEWEKRERDRSEPELITNIKKRHNWK